MGGMQQMLLDVTTAAPFTPAVWGSTSADGDGQTISGAGLIATYATPTNPAHRANCRTTSTRNNGIRQCNFRFTGTNTAATFGAQTAAGPVIDDNIYSTDAFGVLVSTGQVYRNVIVGATFTGGGLTTNAWYAMVYDSAGGSLNVTWYNASGTLLATSTFNVGSGTPIYLSAGCAAGTVVPTCIVEIDPLCTATSLFGGAQKWDS